MSAHDIDGRAFLVTIPGAPPTVNETYKIVTVRGKTRLAKTSAVSTWQDTVAFLVRAAKPTGWTAARRVRIVIEWWMPREGRDADGPVKALLDGIKVGLGVDDRYFLHTIRSIEVDRANPRTEVWIGNELE